MQAYAEIINMVYVFKMYYTSSPIFGHTDFLGDVYTTIKHLWLT